MEIVAAAGDFRLP